MSQHSKASCAIEYSQSLQCIETKSREECEAVFEAYKSCLKLHHSPQARRRRRQQGEASCPNTNTAKETGKTNT